MSRIVLHLDMDYFFAQIEEREEPRLKGKPVVVGADPKKGKGRGVVSTCNYVAREYGIHSAMPISKAYHACPFAVFVKPEFRLYGETSRNIMSILIQYANRFQQVSVDEAYLDFTDTVSSFEEAKELAWKIKKQILEEEKLTCSIGIASSKLVAKIASEFNKPDGIVVVKPHNVKEFLAPLAVRTLPGVGPKAEETLLSMGIRSVGDLQEALVEVLTRRFGSYGYHLHELSLGIDFSTVKPRGEAKSISHEHTFEKDVSAIAVIDDAMRKLSEKVYSDTVDDNVSFKTISIKLRWSNFETITRAKTLFCQASDFRTIYSVACRLVQKELDEERKIRLLGVRVASLSPRLIQTTLYTFCPNSLNEQAPLMY